MTTNVWVEQEWHDYKLKWNPEDYGGVETLHVPSEHIWLPDIVLYNNADGNYEVTIMTKAILNHTGKVDLRHISQIPGSDTIDMGIDLQDYYLSVEWDIMRVPAVRNEKFYSCCEKVSLCISILLSLTVFFLLLAEIIPPTSLTVPLLGKYLLFTMVLVTLSVVVTIAVLNVNFRSPVTHRMAPWVQRIFIQMLPKVLFIERPQQDQDDEATTVIATTPGSENTCVGLDDGMKGEGAMGIFEIPDMDKFGVYQKRYSPTEYDIAGALRYDGPFETSGLPPLPPPLLLPAGSAISAGDDDICGGAGGGDLSPSIEKCIAQEIEKAITDARFIAQHVKNKDKFENVEEDWKYVAMVLDRLFLWIFSVACVMGTCLIILQAPSLYDTTKPIDIQYSKIAKKKLMLMMMGPEEE
ncbi:hypothetical protein B566_EDAN008662 [Ephemera danica]|nr:hypothetical protein B566_EDAN008662 [Ephemera danica]